MDVWTSKCPYIFSASPVAVNRDFKITDPGVKHTLALHTSDQRSTYADKETGAFAPVIMNGYAMEAEWRH